MAKKLLPMLLCVLCPVIASAELPMNGSFETVMTVEPSRDIENEPIPDLGVWYGDPASIVAAENGVTPAEGNFMMRFLGGGGSQSNIYQFVSTPPELRGTDVRFEALFNATEVSPVHSMGLVSLSDSLVAGSPYPSSFGEHIVSESIDLDTDPLTWELFQVELNIPNDSQTLVFNVNGTNSNAAVYADRVRLVPEPSSFALLIPLLFVFVCRRGIR